MAVFDPLFLIGFQSGMWGVALATVCSISLPTLFLYVCFFRGKFTVKFSLSQYLNRRLNPQAIDALKVSIGQFISATATSIPYLVLAKYVADSASAIGEYAPTMAAWNVMDRLFLVAISGCNAITQGFLPAASFAFGSGRLNRMLRLAFVSVGIGVLWMGPAATIIPLLRAPLARIWGDDPVYLRVCENMLVLAFCSCFLNPFAYALVGTLQAMKMVVMSAVTSTMVFFAPIPVIGTALYLTNRRDPSRLIYSFIGHDVTSFIVVVIVAIWKLRFLAKEVPSAGYRIKAVDDDSEIEDALQSAEDEP
jgi:Na+-driven multidrug efflux pump